VFERILGRYSAEDIIDPINGDTILKTNKLIDEDVVAKTSLHTLFQVRTRSVLTCESKSGICKKCYGLNLATNKVPEIGDAIGIMAAQSIGEPGTQLTLRTFHIGRTASRIIEQSHRKTKVDGVIKYSKSLQFLSTKDDEGKKINVCNVRNGEFILYDNKKKKISSWLVPYSSKLHVKDGAKVKADEILFSWDPYTDVILARSNGVVRFKDLIDSETFVEEAIDDGKNNICVRVPRKQYFICFNFCPIFNMKF
jgi:DNA-directed RNA polymerase subunit beta'